ncbi:MAG: tetratricopeptide repeat protein [Gemmataceae bacterium]|nr:tetratricopeptide repeat protein [Gemmataceae bacterium]
MRPGVGSIRSAVYRNPDNATFYWTQAIDWIEKSATENSIPPEPQIARFYRNRGDIWLDNKEYERAIKDFARALSLNASDAEARDSITSIALLVAT